jgi:hypothetical protein
MLRAPRAHDGNLSIGVPDRKLEGMKSITGANLAQQALRMVTECGCPIEIEIDVVFEIAMHGRASYRIVEQLA